MYPMLALNPVCSWDDSELLILLPLSSTCWDDRHTPAPCLPHARMVDMHQQVQFMWSRDLNPGFPAPEASTLLTELHPSHVKCHVVRVFGCREVVGKV